MRQREIGKKLIALMLLAISFAETPAASAWGNQGHLYVNQSSGWSVVGTQHKIHALFETTYVDENITAKDFSNQVHAPEHLTDPFQLYVAYLRESNGKVETIYALEKAGGFSGKGTPEARTFTTQRLAAASQMLLNLWYTAWQDSAINPDSPRQ